MDAQTIAIYTLVLILSCNFLGLIVSFLPFTSTAIYNHRIQKKHITVQTFIKRMPLITLNIALLAGLSVVGLYYLFPLFDATSQMVVTTILFQLFIIFVLDDLFFYFFHRWMHRNKYILKTIHSIHHRATAPFALDYLYVHPLEWMIGYIGPFIGIILIGLVSGINYWAFFAYILIRNLHEIDIHSGFPSLFSKYIPLWGESEHHDMHHEKLLGNYASTFVIWDKIFKTKI